MRVEVPKDGRHLREVNCKASGKFRRRTEKVIFRRFISEWEVPKKDQEGHLQEIYERVEVPSEETGRRRLLKEDQESHLRDLVG